MYFLLFLFFVSLTGILLMVGRKLAMIENGQIAHSGEHSYGAKYLEELKHTTLSSIKRHGYVGLVATIRIYIQSSNFLKNRYGEVKIKVKSLRGSKSNDGTEEKQEINNFLKLISEYKHKIREIKHKIKKEEERK